MDAAPNTPKKSASHPAGTTFVTVTLSAELTEKLRLLCEKHDISKNALFVSTLAMLPENDLVALYDKACESGAVRRQNKRLTPPLTARDVSRQLRALTPEQLAALASQIETMTAARTEAAS